MMNNSTNTRKLVDHIVKNIKAENNLFEYFNYLI